MWKSEETFIQPSEPAIFLDFIISLIYNQAFQLPVKILYEIKFISPWIIALFSLVLHNASELHAYLEPMIYSTESINPYDRVGLCYVFCLFLNLEN